jgi:hypothetical protein
MAAKGGKGKRARSRVAVAAISAPGSKTTASHSNGSPSAGSRNKRTAVISAALWARRWKVMVCPNS